MLRGGLHRAAFLLGEGQKRSRRCMHCLLPGNGTENAARCTGPRSTLHEPSHRAASAIAPHCPSQASSDEGKQQSTGAIRPPRRTNSRPPTLPPNKEHPPKRSISSFRNKNRDVSSEAPRSFISRKQSQTLQQPVYHIGIPHSEPAWNLAPRTFFRIRHQDEAQSLTRNAAFAIRAQRVLPGEQALCLTPPGTKG